MPQLTGNLENNRILIPVGIRKFEESGPVDGSSSVTHLDYHQFMALVDTGARRTCISYNVVHKVGLRRFSQTDVWNVKREERHWTYLFHVGFWPDVQDNAPSSIFGIGDAIEGIDVGNHPYFDVLIGMDIISKTDLIIRSSGIFEIHF